jgi:hypothetical protein
MSSQELFELPDQTYSQVRVIVRIRDKKPNRPILLRVLRGPLHIADLGVHHTHDFLGNPILRLKPNHTICWSALRLPIRLKREPNSSLFRRQPNLPPKLSERRQRRATLVTWIESLKHTRETRPSAVIY